MREYGRQIKMAPAVLPAPRSPATESEVSVTAPSLPEKPRERMHLVLKEAEESYRHELLDTEERLLLHERILRLKKKLAVELAR
jgi:hypothetical protein